MTDLIATDAVSINQLRRDAIGGRLYAILDACDEPRVPRKVRELGPARAVSLYRGPAEEDLAAIAPYLVQVGSDELDWIAASLWSSPWGIFALSDAGLEPLRSHFRKFLLVDAPDGDRWYFRFYDPRVLERFLPTCSAPQLAEFFGPVAACGWTSPDYGVTLARQRSFEPAPPSRPRVTLRSR
ncbi:MAG TPA: DUF4123 domain-containing protein [Gemmatimonadales bacterium]|nr:DUF4123 domain-containing protein [Gemmatimonadales bacterium]